MTCKKLGTLCVKPRSLCKLTQMFLNRSQFESDHLTFAETFNDFHFTQKLKSS